MPEALRKARTTKGVRAAVTELAGRREAVAAAAEGMDDDAGKRVLEGYAGALEAAAPLGSLSGETLDTWDTTRVTFAEGMSSLGVAAGSAGSGVRGDVRPTVSALDELVERGEQALATWDARTASERSERDDALQAVDEYVSSFRSQAKEYDRLRVALGDLTDQLEAGQADLMSAAAAFQSAYAQREGVRDALMTADVPTALRGEHDAVVEVVRRGMRGVLAAQQGLSEVAYCTDCAYDDYLGTDGWRTFQEESDDISKDYAKAVRAWQASSARVRAQTAARPLPARPEV